MITSAQLAALESAAETAENDPERRCQVAMAALYKTAKLLPVDVVIPNGNRDHADTGTTSLIEEWLATSIYFSRVDVAERAPGDLIVFRLLRIGHHVGIMLEGGRLVHVYGKHGLKIAPCIPGPWRDRISSAWRLTT